MHDRNKIIAVTMACVVLGGCALESDVPPADEDRVSSSEPPPPAGDVLLVADQASYGIVSRLSGWEGKLGFAYNNETGETISLVNCNGGFGLSLEKWEEGAWVPGWYPILPGCLSPPIEIAPQATYEFTVPFFAGHPDGNHYPKLEVDEVEGHYRLVLVHSAFWNYDPDGGPTWGDELPLDLRVSDAFLLTTR